MPVTPTYPGVYIEEVPSQVRTIVGVATSITAFVGRTRRGPVNRCTRIQSWGDFERTFGGLWFHSTLSYAVRQFFQNGGSDAIIVRIVDSGGEAAAIDLAIGGGPATLSLEASSSGEWGNRIRVRVTGGNLEVDEVDEAGSTNPVILNHASYPTATLEAALQADDSLVVAVSDPFPSAPPDSIAWTYLSGGANAAERARASLPVTREELGLEAHTSIGGEAGNDLRATVIHSTSDEDNFGLVLEQLDTGGQAIAAERYGPLTEATVAGDLGTSSLVSAPTVVPSVRPDEVMRAVFTGGSASPATQASLALLASVDSLNLVAANEGDWGNGLRAVVDYATAAPNDTGLFNLTVEELDASGNVVVREILRNVTLNEQATQYIETVLEAESNLARVAPGLPSDRPLDDVSPFARGDDGGELEDSDYQGSQTTKTGFYALEEADLFNLLCIPPRSRTTDVGPSVLADALQYCQERRAMLIVDPPSNWNDPADAEDPSTGIGGLRTALGGAAFSVNAIVYFPRLNMPDQLRDNRTGEFAACGAVAGVVARTDAQRGVWKAPAGIEASFTGVRGASYLLTDDENGRLNPLGLNCLRTFPVYGHVMWGARTLAGDDRLASQWKYIPVRRLALFIEESLYRGTQWVVFEPNDESLWAQIRLNVGAFMHNLFRQGAFQGTTPRKAYFVKCDSETTTQNDIDLGIVNILVGFAPLKPAEFVIIKISQIAGEIQT